jgi:hypothetical protein
MSIGAFDTHTLLGVVQHLPSPNAFWLNFFGQTVNFDTEYIDFDVLDKGRRMAPFVAPNVAGKPMNQKGYDVRRFKPAYIKPKMPFEPSRVIKRRAGEGIGGTLSPDQRRNAIVADMFSEMRAMVERRWEWMAAQALITGSVVVVGEDYPSVTISFSRDAGQTITLTGNDLWTDKVNSHPLQRLETVLRQTMRLKHGGQTRDLVFGTTAWAAFIDHPDVIEALDTRRGSTLTLETTSVLGNSEFASYKGQLPNGGPRLWVYSDFYEDNSGAAVEMLDPTYVIGIGEPAGVRAYGAILDKKANYSPVSMFPKMWEEEDPSVEMLMLQSAPLMIPTRPNSTFRIKVA